MSENMAQTPQGGTQESGSAFKSVAAAAIAAAVAGMIARKLSSDGEDQGQDGSNGGRAQNGAGQSQSGRAMNPMFGSIASGGWDAARDALLPAAEDAAGAAGTFVAQNAPEIVRDRIVPRFIASFNEARGG